MVSKCANPSCSTAFRYLHEGKLFRIETPMLDPPLGGSLYHPGRVKMVPRSVEFYWLCSACAAVMTLVFEPGVGVRTKPLPPVLPAAS
jgi:hypothetical protein